MDLPLAAESDASGLFNIGRGERTATNRLAELIAGLMGKDVEPFNEQPQPGDVKHSLADISRARGFAHNPKWGLTERPREIANKADLG